MARNFRRHSIPGIGGPDRHAGRGRAAAESGAGVAENLQEDLLSC
jgi:hypothetical protein